MGNIGSLFSVGKISNSDNNLKFINFYTNQNTFATKGVDINNEIITSTYVNVNKSSTLKLDSSNTNDALSNTLGFLFVKDGKLFQVRHDEVNRLYLLDGINISDGSVNSTQIGNSGVRQAARPVKINGSYYLGMFDSSSDIVKFYYTNINDGTTYVQPSVTISGSGSAWFAPLQDETNGYIYFMTSQHKLYKYDFNSNTYTLVKTINSASVNSSYNKCVYNNIFYGVNETSSTDSFFSYNLLTDETTTIREINNASTFSLSCCKHIVVLCYMINNTTFSFCYDIINNVFSNGSNLGSFNKAVAIPTIDIPCCFAVNKSSSNIVTQCFSSEVYEGTKNNIIEKLVGVYE